MDAEPFSSQPPIFAPARPTTSNLITILFYNYSTSISLHHCTCIDLAQHIDIFWPKDNEDKWLYSKATNMWESKDNALDATYNADHLWFDGIGGLHTQKPVDIRKWEESKCHKLIEKHFPKVKADKMLADLSSIALEWAKNFVRQRQTFKLNTKGENMAPLAFQSDPDGTYIDLAVQLRNVDALHHEGKKEMPIVESMDIASTEGSPDQSRYRKSLERRSETPAVLETPARIEEMQFRKQREIIEEWIHDPKHTADDTCRRPLELYAQLNDSEFLYVTDLQRTYDEARCFFLQWVLGKEIKELVNSARISAV